MKCSRRLQLSFRRWLGVEGDHVQGLADPLLDAAPAAAMAVTAAAAQPGRLDHDWRLPKETGIPAVVVVVTTYKAKT